MAGELEAIKSWPEKTRTYIDDLKVEMKRVTWPTRKQVESTTVIVIFTVFAFAAYFGVVDFTIDHTVTKIYSSLSKVK